MKPPSDTPSADPAGAIATAWALGELDPAESAAFETAMAADPVLASRARNLKDFAVFLQREFVSLPAPSPATTGRQENAASSAGNDCLSDDTRRQLAVLLTGSPDQSSSAEALAVSSSLPTPSATLRLFFLRRPWPAVLALGTAAAACTAMLWQFLLTDAGQNPLQLTGQPAGQPASQPGPVPASLISRLPDPPAAPAAEMPHPLSPATFTNGGPAPHPGVPASAAASMTAAAAPAASQDTSIIVQPEMPKALFAGTPLPANTLPPNFDLRRTPVLEAAVPSGTVLLSLHCPVTSSDPAPIGDLSLITDGENPGDDGYFVDLQPGRVWVQIDLGQSRDIHLLWVWHFFKQNVIFNDVIIQISDDPAFAAANSTTVFNNDYDNSYGLGIGRDQTYGETNNGRAIPVPPGVRGRYVRLHSNGRDLDDTNQYIEVSVYGIPSPASPPPAAPAEPVPPAPAATSPAWAGLEKTDGPGRNAAPAGRVAHEKMELTQRSSSPALPPASRTSSLPASTGPVAAATIQPQMPKPLFTGTPLPHRITSIPLFGAEAKSGSGSSSPQHAAAGWMESPPSPPGTESYRFLPPATFQNVRHSPLSTFAVDVDTASYSNVRRFLNLGQRPPAGAVRLEEMVNYFPYDEPSPPDSGPPFAVRTGITTAPWNPAHQLARVVLKGRGFPEGRRPAGNLVFLVDVSGSMAEPNKLPLVQESLRLLTEQLHGDDRVSLVTYAGSTSVVLPSTSAHERARILAAIDSLRSGGGTNGAGGLALAYQQAALHFVKDGINRVILATDGDFNIGPSSHDELLALIGEHARTGVFLSVLGYGMGNLKDDTMELLADRGNGNYACIDSLSEARKALAGQLDGTLATIAKDVKIQIEFNPAAVGSWRLLGYENRQLAKEDFHNDRRDAGEIGAGHTVTALYELIPSGVPGPAPGPDKLKYQQAAAPSSPGPASVPSVPAGPAPAPGTPPDGSGPAPGTPFSLTGHPGGLTPAALTGELMTIKLRWKQPQGETSALLEIPVSNHTVPLAEAGTETRWAAAVAGYAQLLRGDAPPALTWESVRQLARSAKGADPFGYRGEFLQLLDKAERVMR